MNRFTQTFAPLAWGLLLSLSACGSKSDTQPLTTPVPPPERPRLDFPVGVSKSYIPVLETDSSRKVKSMILIGLDNPAVDFFKMTDILPDLANRLNYSYLPVPQGKSWVRGDVSRLFFVSDRRHAYQRLRGGDLLANGRAIDRYPNNVCGSFVLYNNVFDQNQPVTPVYVVANDKQDCAPKFVSIY